MKELRNLRKLSGLSQKQLADELNVGQCAVSKWEQGCAYPKAALLPKLADALGCTIDALYGRGEENENV